MTKLKDPKYDGKGGLWKQHHPKIAAQGNIQIGGRVIALTVWHNNKGGSAPELTISVNEQKTSHDDIVWFRALSKPILEVHPASNLVDSRPTHTKPAVPSHPDYKDDDIPF